MCVQLSLLSLLLLVIFLSDTNEKLLTRNVSITFHKKKEQVRVLEKKRIQHNKLNILFYYAYIVICVCEWMKKSLTSLHFKYYFYHGTSRILQKICGIHAIRYDTSSYLMWECLYECVCVLFTILLSHCHLTIECRLCTHYTLPQTHLIHPSQYLQCIWDLLCFNYRYTVERL